MLEPHRADRIVLVRTRAVFLVDLELDRAHGGPDRVDQLAVDELVVERPRQLLLRVDGHVARLHVALESRRGCNRQASDRCVERPLDQHAGRTADFVIAAEDIVGRETTGPGRPRRDLRAAIGLQGVRRLHLVVAERGPLGPTRFMAAAGVQSGESEKAKGKALEHRHGCSSIVVNTEQSGTIPDDE